MVSYGFKVPYALSRGSGGDGGTLTSHSFSLTPPKHHTDSKPLSFFILPLTSS